MKIEDIVSRIETNYDNDEFSFNREGLTFPSRSVIIDIIKGLRALTFPGYFTDRAPSKENPTYYIGELLLELSDMLYSQVRSALQYTNSSEGTEDDRNFHMDIQCEEDLDCKAREICDAFFEELPHVQELLLKDVQAAYEGDPAAQSKQEVIFSYPGLFAVFIYRFAHVLYTLRVPLIPRIMTEYAHSGTGVDINAGATIGEYFFMDHATGIVIGETTVIGDHVKLYQGVTLGALSTKDVQELSGKKRHPTIENNVVIYSNASILGGETVIGENSVIGGSAFITSSVPPNTTVAIKAPQLSMREADA